MSDNNKVNLEEMKDTMSRLANNKIPSAGINLSVSTDRCILRQNIILFKLLLENLEKTRKLEEKINEIQKDVIELT